jgi:hypothetical protein
VLHRVGGELHLDDERFPRGARAATLGGNAQHQIGAILGRVELAELGRGDLDVRTASAGKEPGIELLAERLRNQHGHQPRALAQQLDQGFVQGRGHVRAGTLHTARDLG